MKVGNVNPTNQWMLICLNIHICIFASYNQSYMTLRVLHIMLADSTQLVISENIAFIDQHCGHAVNNLQQEYK
jgi:hypothetical protein